MVRIFRFAFNLVRQRLLALPPALAGAAVLGVAVFVLTGMYGSYRVYSYTQDDPVFCRSCHTMEKAWDRWSQSAHNKVNCHSCHESSPVESFEQVFKYAISKPDEVNKHALVSDEACKKCHESNDPRWIQVENTAGHKVHAVDQRISCLKCHSVTVHNFEPPAKICLACHGNSEVKMTKMAERYCTDCHNYLAESNSLKPGRKECLDCHETLAKTEVHWPTNAPMQFQCSQCHQPHKQQKPEVACQSCHQNQDKKGLHEAKGHQAANCQTCHKPHEWKVTERQTCYTCHGERVNHKPDLFCGSCHNFKT